MLYFSPFSPGYWREALSALKSLRVLTFAALMVALEVIVSFLNIPLSVDLQLQFTYLVISVSSLVCGPLVALISGCAADLISFFVSSGGYTFFFGYTVTAMLSAFVYALFLFRARISVVRILCCKTLINFVVHVWIGSIWRVMLFGQGFWYYIAKSLFKNIIFLPLEVLLITLLLRMLLPSLAQIGLTPKQPENRIRLLAPSKRQII